MIKSYFLCAIRFFRQHKMITLINVFGLSIAMGFCLYAYFYTQHEFSCDKFHKEYNRIYRLDMRHHYDLNPEIPYAFGGFLQMRLPEIESYVRFEAITPEFDREDYLSIQMGNERIFEPYTCVDSSFFSVFSFPLKFGDRRTALNNAQSVVLTYEMWKKYFPNENPIGKDLVVYSNRGWRNTYTITGVLHPIPSNSSIKINLLFRFDNYTKIRFNDFRDPDQCWDINLGEMFLKVKPNSDIHALEKKLMQILNDSPVKGKDRYETLKLQPLKDMHFKGSWNSVVMSSRPIAYRLFIGLALLILMLAISNYTNLSLGLYSSRGREIGVRKTIGSKQSQIVWQFLTESVLIVCFSLALSFFWFDILASFFKLDIIHTLHLKIDFLNIRTWISIFALVLFVGLCAGFYPAIIMATQKPVTLVKNEFHIKNHSFLKLGSIFIQFIVISLVIVFSIVFVKQLNFMVNPDHLGFNTKNIFFFKVEDLTSDQRSILYEKLKRNTDIQYTGFSEDDDFMRGGGYYSKVKMKNGEEERFTCNYINNDMFKVLNLQLLQGCLFDEDTYGKRKDHVIVTQSFVEKMGYDQPIGQSVEMYTIRPGTTGLELATIIGVVKDFQWGISMKREIQPCLLLNAMNAENTRIFFIKLTNDKISDTIGSIQKIWYELAPNCSFEYHFLIDYINNAYMFERLILKILNFIATLSIILAGLGILGMVSLNMGQQRKELAIRKILGSTHLNLFLHIIKYWMIPILGAQILSIPVGYFVMNKWLQNYAYRIDLTIWPFVLTGLFALLIALFCISWQVIKAINANPVESLRYE